MSSPRWRERRGEHRGDMQLGGKKKPPPADGIKMKKAGTTWWGKRWIAALEEVLGGQAGRLARGRSYARAGRVHDLVVKEGAVAARVTGTAAHPYRVNLALEELAEDVWETAMAVMAAKAQFAAALLAGEMPEDVDDVFRGAGRSLFPRERAEMSTRCSCPDSGDPCKHVAATHYVLGEALDRDPFLLFELRGRTRDEVLDELRRARGHAQLRAGAHPANLATAARVADATIASATGDDLSNVSAADYDRAPEPLPKLQFSFEAHASTGNVLRQLGAPPGWSEPSAPAEAFASLIRSAAEAARRVAMEEPVASAAPPITRPTPARSTPAKRRTSRG